jgi:hypothetical protein
MEGYQMSEMKMETSKGVSVSNERNLALEMSLPTKIYGVANHELNIYFSTIVYKGIGNYHIKVRSEKGTHESRRWTYIPSCAEKFEIMIELYDDNGAFITSKSSLIIIQADTVGKGITKKALVIGDSTVNAKKITKRMLNNFSTDPMSLKLIGSRGTAPNLHEGRGGWSAASYRTDLECDGKINPFYNEETSDFDFAHYIKSNGYMVPDYVFIHLGINDTFLEESDSAINMKIEKMIVDYDYIIDNIRAFDSNIRIGLNVTIPPNVNQDAFGASYGCLQTQWRYKRNNFIWTTRMIDYYDGREDENIYIVSTHLNIDPLSGFPADNAVHPNEYGYGQIGDVMYYFIKSFES